MEARISGKRVLLTGALGMLGRRVHEVLREKYDVVATARVADGGRGVQALDVTSGRDVRAVTAAHRPAIVVNCAGYTAVDRAESEPDLAWKVNAEAPGMLAAAAAAAGGTILHVSSDFVFDGEKRTPYVETDPVNPQSVYAKSKEGGERLVREHAPRHAIVRTQWLYGEDGKHFPGTILRLRREGKPLRVVDDQVGSPTYARDVAEAIGRILDAELQGTIHVANRGQASWFEFAKAVLELAGEPAPVQPIESSQFSAPAKRPAYSVLRNAVLEATIGDSMRPWRDALAAFAHSGGMRAPGSPA
jgi:dTDP-4-dehydrorhamnose reductase